MLIPLIITILKHFFIVTWYALVPRINIGITTWHADDVHPTKNFNGFERIFRESQPLIGVYSACVVVAAAVVVVGV